MTFREQIEEIIRENGWEGRFVLEESPPGTIGVRLSEPHPGGSENDGLVNIYVEGQTPFEQVQQECLRALRTGRPGL